MAMKVKTLFILIGALAMVQGAMAADFTNFMGMKFNTVQPGVFFMGSCKPEKGTAEQKKVLFGLVKTSACPNRGNIDDAALADELPQHKVEISKSFQLAMHEVTLKQFMTFYQTTGRTVTENFKKHNSHGDESAVTWVSWFQTQSFLTWLNQNKPAGDRGTYRLPTEAEWEYAARAGSNTTYFFGDKSTEISRFAWIIKDSQSYGQVWSQPVGLKQPNPWGFYDIYGNVQEWVQDVYSATYYQESPAIDPKGPEHGANQVIRGCSLYSSAKNCRSARRYFLPADQRKGIVGFRVARELP